MANGRSDRTSPPEQSHANKGSDATRSPFAVSSGNRGIFMGESRYDKYEELSVLRSFTRLDAASKRREREEEMDERSRMYRQGRMDASGSGGGRRGERPGGESVGQSTVDGGAGLSSSVWTRVRTRRSREGGGSYLVRTVGVTLAFTALCAAAWLTSGGGGGAVSGDGGANLTAFTPKSASQIGATVMRSLNNVATAVFGERSAGEDQDDEVINKFRQLRSSGGMNSLREEPTQATRGLAAITKKRHHTTQGTPLRILSLGGSTTYGAHLEQRSQAYPYVLANELLPPGSTVTNLALRATGSDYAGMCLQSMVTQHGPDGGASSVLSPQDGDAILEGRGDVNYDVILVEYSLNGLHGLPLLLRRLRRRYPHKPIVYVHLWSLRESVVDVRTGAAPRRATADPALTSQDADARMREMLLDPSAQWAWDTTSEYGRKLGDAKSIMEKGMDVGLAAENPFHHEIFGIYELPMPVDPRITLDENWFGPDFHHLSAVGHDLVARGLRDLVSNVSHRTINREKTAIGFGDQRLIITGSWGSEGSHVNSGDQCISWYETGKLLQGTTTQGGKLRMFVANDKYALHVMQDKWGGKSTIEFENTFDLPMEVGVTAMVWKEGVYPKARITVMPVSDDDKSQVDHVRREYILEPVHPDPSFRTWHVTNTFFGGVEAPPGRNVIVIEPLEVAERPLRVTGLVMCAACGSGNDAPGARVTQQ